jgi:hypothetical protein
MHVDYANLHETLSASTRDPSNCPGEFDGSAQRAFPSRAARSVRAFLAPCCDCRSGDDSRYRRLVCAAGPSRPRVRTSTAHPVLAPSPRRHASDPLPVLSQRCAPLAPRIGATSRCLHELPPRDEDGHSGDSADRRLAVHRQARPVAAHPPTAGPRLLRPSSACLGRRPLPDLPRPGRDDGSHVAANVHAHGQLPGLSP